MPERLFQALVARPAGDSVLAGRDNTLSAETVLASVDQLAILLRTQATRVLAVLADNGPGWVIADLAALRAGLTHLPLPPFFTPAQLAHALDAAGADSVLTDTPERIAALDLGFSRKGQCLGMVWMRRDIPAVALPAGTAKISFTSGSTGQPKGVCLSADGLMDTAQAVCAALADIPVQRHLSVLPLALLLENVAGVYAPLLRGARVALPSLGEIGWRGMGGFDPAALAGQVAENRANSVILVPELLKAWTLHLMAARERAPEFLHFVAVGGSRSDPGQITRARNLGLPAYEGYGLTECGSVVSLNRPGADQPDSVGRPLGHVRIRVDTAREIHVHSPAFRGYLNTPHATGTPWPTGDLGHLDHRGYLRLSGRRKHLLITSYGRNVAPEWVEAALTAQPEIAQAVVTGDGRPWLVALLVPSLGVEPARLAAAVARAHNTLPDYARIGDWLVCPPFTPHNHQASGNGRPKRDAITAHYASEIGSLYAATVNAHALP